MTGAAEAVHISQPALSQYLKKLETKMGAQLFIRSGSGRLELTDAGRIYQKFCEDILKRWHEAEKDLKALSSRPEALRIGVALSRRAITFLNCFSRLKQSYPELDMRIGSFNVQDIPGMVLDGTLDIGFSAWMEQYPGLTYHRFLCREICLMVPCDNPLAAYSCLKPGQEDLRIPISAVGDQPMLGLRGGILGTQIEDFLERENFRPNFIFRLKSSAEIQTFAENFHYLSIVTPKELLPNMVPVRLKNAFEYVGGYYYRNDYVITEGGQKLVDAYIREVLAEEPVGYSISESYSLTNSI